jgi:hypothetical protein
MQHEIVAEREWAEDAEDVRIALEIEARIQQGLERVYNWESVKAELESGDSMRLAWERQFDDDARIDAAVLHRRLARSSRIWRRSSTASNSPSMVAASS